MNGNISHLSKKGRPGFSIQLIQDATTPRIGSQFKHGIGKGEDLFNIPMIQMLFAITTLGNDPINKVHMEGNCTQLFNKMHKFIVIGEFKQIFYSDYPG